MSNESPPSRHGTAEDELDSGAENDWTLTDRLDVWLGPATGRERITLVAGAVALALVAGTTMAGIVRNLPYDPIALPEWLWTLGVSATPVVVALALVAVAVASSRETVRVGLLFAGVFGLLAAIDSGATLPAVVAVTGGSGIALFGGVGRPTTYRQLRRTTIAAVIVAGVAVSLTSTAGLVGVGFRQLGGILSLAGVAALGVRADGDRLAVVAGLLTVGVVLFASVTRPFVVGSGILVGFSVVDVPHLLVTVVFGGGAAAIVAGLRRQEYSLAIGAGLLVFAGVPATVTQATAVALGALLALVSTERLVSVDPVSEESEEVAV